ncbi:hypothetical protein V1509DRAFT_613251 [Lipomyces kononenkoae]
MGLETWLTLHRTIVQKGKMVDMPQAQEERIMNCSSAIARTQFCTTNTGLLMRGEALGKTLEQIIGEFKMYQNPRQNKDKQKFAFASLGGESSTQKCSIQKVVNEAMKNPTTRKSFEQHNSHSGSSKELSKGNGPATKTSPIADENRESAQSRSLHAAYTAFNTNTDDDQDISLITSWLVDTANDTHVGNDLQSFRDFRPTSNSTLPHGNTASSIVGFGDVVIMIEYGDQQREFTLKDVAYIPGFHTNFVCFARLKRAGISLDSENNRLVYRNSTQIFANLLPSGSFWVMSRSTICPAQPDRAQVFVNAVN